MWGLEIEPIFLSPPVDCVYLDFEPLLELTKIVFYTLEILIYLKNIHLCASIFSILFIEESPLCKLTKMAFSIVENVSPDECTPLWKCFQFFLQIITSSGVDKNGVFYTWNCFLPEEYIPNCVIWLKQCFLHLQTSSIWRIYTSVRVFFNFFSWRIFT